MEVAQMDPPNIVYDSVNNMHIACRGNRLSLLPTTPARWLLGRRATLTVRGIKDIAGNLAEPNNAALIEKGLVQLQVHFADAHLTTYVENLEMLDVTTESSCLVGPALASTMAAKLKIPASAVHFEKAVCPKAMLWYQRTVWSLSVWIQALTSSTPSRSSCTPQGPTFASPQDTRRNSSTSSCQTSV